VKLAKIPLKDLAVNRENDRHGELIDEDAAIEWLLTRRSSHMRNLTKDIVTAGEIYEPPLVSSENGKYVVYDGNRRMAVLKLLGNPERAPSQDWAKFFREQRGRWTGKFPEQIECQVENDRTRLDEILYRRHTGQQRGIGQSQWDAEAKSNFERRTGKNTRINVAEEIEKLLHAKELLKPVQKIPRSNMNRLLSAEQFRNRVGIAIEGNRLKFTHSESKVLAALQQIAKDLISKEITLDDIWDNDDKRAYLNKLDKKKTLPTIDDALPSRKAVKTETFEADPPQKEGYHSKVGASEKRRTLIRNIDYGLVQSHHNRRALDIFTELQHRLKFDEHDNAVAVLFRVLIELSIEIYISQNGVSDIQKNDKLARKYSKTLAHMLSQTHINKAYYDGIKKFENSDPIISANTLHAYVHSADFFPSDHHLKSMWDTLEKFVIVCLKS
jgi:hypothetical protein